MARSETKKKWDEENSYMVGVRFQRKTDQDIIDFLEGKNKRDVICAALRLLMQEGNYSEDTEKMRKEYQEKRERCMKSPTKVYQTATYQYFINQDDHLCRFKLDKLEDGTLSDADIEVLD